MPNTHENDEEEFDDELLPADDPDADRTAADGETFEHYRFVADPKQGLLRIDKFVVDRVMHASRTKIKDAAEAGNIRVNDVPVKANYRVKPGDVVTIVMFPKTFRSTLCMRTIRCLWSTRRRAWWCTPATATTRARLSTPWLGI